MMTRTKIIIGSIITALSIGAVVILNLSCKTNELPVVVAPSNSSEVIVAPATTTSSSVDTTAIQSQVVTPTNVTTINITPGPSMDLNDCEKIKQYCQKCKLGF